MLPPPEKGARTFHERPLIGRSSDPNWDSVYGRVRRVAAHHLNGAETSARVSAEAAIALADALADVAPDGARALLSMEVKVSD